MSYLDENGLVDGKIPAGSACPWHETCDLKMDRCPSKEKPKENAFSCALARLNSMIASSRRLPVL